jgi:hypothetical protein
VAVFVYLHSLPIASSYFDRAYKFLSIDYNKSRDGEGNAMDIFLIELLLWGGLLLLFWGLKDGLGKIEAEIETLGLLRKEQLPENSTSSPIFAIPEETADMIGIYLDAPIYDYVTIEGERYVFDHVHPVNQIGVSLKENERCLAPGLVYVRVRRDY